MTELEKLKAGLEYCYDDPEVEALKERAIIWCREYNAIPDDDDDYEAQYAHLENYHRRPSAHADGPPQALRYRQASAHRQ